MAFLDRFKVRKALLLHQRGRQEEAIKLYEQLYQDGVLQANYILPYSVLLLRAGGEENFKKVREMMVKIQKAPDLSEDRRQQLLMNYAIAAWKTGDLDRAISTLESSHQKSPCSLTYQSLGFLYIEAGDAQKALEYNLEALDYDDVDPITLDNLGQIHFRLLNDQKAARPYFEKAHQIKPGQIDTLYFLSLYDDQEGRVEEAIRKLETSLEGNFSPLNYSTREMVNQQLEKLRGKSKPMQTEE